ncbi:hypothetical protein BOTBODRAFT_39314 [Botryobasidium botryosum FD-172 SS1]|uniref:Secreted protein n=1 Tax=Botryobasidium botryosum (strain FD-172 SS1) TaxID=930990 RepID=A0A067M5K7_BOTB1|nr:hypothetical protein BOTBODRAFT_39314 [Botryobasidium botryosum FD-172 SS1]
MGPPLRAFLGPIGWRSLLIRFMAVFFGPSATVPASFKRAPFIPPVITRVSNNCNPRRARGILSNVHSVRIARGPLESTRSLPRHSLSALRSHYVAGRHLSKWSSASRSNRVFFKNHAGFADNMNEESRVDATQSAPLPCLGPQCPSAIVTPPRFP